ncbi:MAG: amidohydrolase family protein [Chloroflexi bacterium]|nr:amidohydrolase family protein [Chloroflexota bacterium]
MPSRRVRQVFALSEYPKSKETPEGFERLQNQPWMIYVSPGTRMFSPFLYMMAAKSHTYQGVDYPERMEDLNRRMVAALHEAGTGILLGTDAAQAYHIPGFSVHEELAYLVDAGLSPCEAIEAGTRNAAEALGKSDEFGTIETGKRADLILLQANPLENWELIPGPASLLETIAAISHVQYDQFLQERQRVQLHRAPFRLHTRSVPQSEKQLQKLVQRWKVLPASHDS